MNEVSQAKYAIGHDGGCGRNDLELQNEYEYSVWNTEWSNESSRGRLEGDAALVSPHCPRCPAPVWLSGMGEGVAKNEQNG